MKNKTIKGLFIFFSVFLFLPFVQHILPFSTGAPLQGYFTNANDIEFSWTKWFDGSYQKGKTEFCNDHVGFRPDLVRLSGQLDYSLFHRLDYSGAIMDDDNSLYYNSYIDAYFGEDFMGYEAILSKMVKLKAIQDTLAHLGKSVILVHEPCKAFYNAGTIKDINKCTGKMPTNFQTFLRIGDSLGINQMDLNTWFVSMKKTTKELLFSKQGIHWTVYGAILAGDSIVKYIEKLRNISMPHPLWTNVVHSSRAWQTDDDLAKVLNLALPVATETFGYPIVTYPKDTTKTKPNVIYIGDSFIVTLMRNGMMANANNNWEFWFYYTDIYKNDPDAYTKVADLDWKSSVNKADCILLMYTSSQLGKFGGGFIEHAYDYYYPSKTAVKAD